MKKLNLIVLLWIFALGYCNAQSSCNPNETITGNYSTPYTKSQTWIATNGTTTILSGTNVVLDANLAAQSYVLLNPGFEAQTGSEMVASVAAVCGSGGPLPVKLIGFSAKIENGKSKLVWQTASEINAMGFDIEKSTNGKEFSKIGFVKAQNKGGFQYQFIDNQTGLNTQYYRLKMIDIDHKFEYSAIKSVQLNDVFEVSVYPNPATDFLEIACISEGISDIELMNMAGQKMLTATKTDSKIDISHLPTGLYYLKIKTKSGKIDLKKIVKK